MTQRQEPGPNNVLKKVVVGSLVTIMGVVIGSFWYQLGGYARADDLEKVKQEVEDVKRNVGDINVRIGSIDTALEILLEGYKKAKKEEARK